jgi:4-alpha-glucanotransferase
LTTLPPYLRHADAAPHWELIGARRRLGVCAPLFSLRSARGCGIGDVADLESLVDWCVPSGLEVVQILPVNDMGRGCCPYSALSAFAIDPVYAAMDRVPGLEGDRVYQAMVADAATRLNASPAVDWDAVRWAKAGLLAEAVRRLDGPALTSELDAFRAANTWLDDWVAFRIVKETEGFRSWEDWADRFPGPGAAAGLVAGRVDRARELAFGQWLLDRQLREARRRAAAAGVLIEGDIPILVARDSADVWANPGLFDLGSMAGAPPDMYSEVGQNWGFPTYDWEALRGRDFDWWRARLRHAERFYDLYRIDHVVGFFRIWTIPLGEKDGRRGRFVPGDESAWGEHGRAILRMMLESTSMLPLAEDLGTIPDVCRETLRDMGICGMKVQRWERRWHGDRGYVDPAGYHPLSVATLATHDSETLAGWWEAAPDERDLLWTTLGHDLPAPAPMPPDAQREVIRWLSGASSLFVIHLLQDLLAPSGLLPGEPADHRINLPGIVNDTNWTWRCPVPLERLLDDTDLAAGIRDMATR